MPRIAYNMLTVRMRCEPLHCDEQSTFLETNEVNQVALHKNDDLHAKK